MKKSLSLVLFVVSAFSMNAFAGGGAPAITGGVGHVHLQGQVPADCGLEMRTSANINSVNQVAGPRQGSAGLMAESEVVMSFGPDIRNKNETQEAKLAIKCNEDFRLTVSSANGGLQSEKNGDIRANLPYTVKDIPFAALAGSATEASSTDLKASPAVLDIVLFDAQQAGATTSEGIVESEYPFNIQLVTSDDLPAGEYLDTLTIELSVP